MKETRELLVFLTKIILKTIENSKDGFKLAELLTYIENITDAPEAFGGIKLIKSELQGATSQDIYTLANSVRELVSKQVDDELLVETVISALTTLLLTYSVTAK